MRTDRRDAVTSRVVARTDVLAGIGVLIIAAVLYTRFDLYGKMIRDSAIYIYGGQRFIHGQPPYVSEMDPKGPVSSILCGFGVAVAKLFGRSDVIVVRLEFCALAVLGVLGIYLLVLELWHSVIAGVVAAVVFTAFKNYAYNALVGTDGHMPGIVFLIFTMWLTARRQWYLAGVAASLAFLTWQPLIGYPLVALLCAVAWSPGHRLRAAGLTLAGVATPLFVLIIWYAAGGYLKNLFQGLFIFPLTGVKRSQTTLGHRLHFFLIDIPRIYGNGAILFWVGLALMLGAAIWTVAAARSQWRTALLSPIVLLITLSFLIECAYVLYDYIGYPHTYPLLPYSAIGFGVATAALLSRLPDMQLRWVTALLTVAVAALAITYAAIYSKPHPHDSELRSQQAGACALKRSLVPHTPLWVVDDPVPLVLLHRRNPDNFPYVGSGLDIWKVQHTPGGFAGWMREIRRSRASIVIVDSWAHGQYKWPVQHWLMTHGYRKGFIGPFMVFTTYGARREMMAHSIALDRSRKLWPLTTSGSTFTITHCTKVAAG